MGHLATLILAAGFSTRMQGLFKPLLPFNFGWPRENTLTALEQLVQLHARSGIEHIIIVGGQRESLALCAQVSEIKNNFQNNNIHLHTNPDASRGMFSSICEGLNKIKQLPDVSHCFIHPVDIALVRPYTLQSLLEARDNSAVLIPFYKGISGHPPLIPAKFIEQILTHAGEQAGEQGLQGALKKLPTKHIHTADSHILYDMDTKEDYVHLQQRATFQHILDPAEALQLLHCLNVPSKGIEHALSVAKVATGFAKGYADKYKKQNKALSINIDLATAGALLHDMCKQEPKHEQAAGQALDKMGFETLARLVEVHNDCTLSADAPVTEKELIYLADKYISGKELVPIEKRFQEKLELYGHIPEAKLAINARLKRAKSMQERVSKELSKDTFLIAMESLQYEQIPN